MPCLSIPEVDAHRFVLASGNVHLARVRGTEVTNTGVDEMIGLYYHERPITLHSGGKSHWFVNADEMFQHEPLRREVLRIWIRSLTDSEGKYQFEAVPSGGILWTEAIHDEIPGSIIRLLNSECQQGYQRVVVDDVVTTGQSIMDVNEMRLVRRLAVVIRNRPAFEWFHNHITFWQYIKLDEFPVWQSSVPQVGKEAS